MNDPTTSFNPNEREPASPNPATEHNDSTTSFSPNEPSPRPANHPTTWLEPDSPVNVILAEYLEACRQGKAPSREELLATHPEFAKDLDSFFAGQEALNKVAPARSPMETATFDGRDRPISAPGDLVGYFGDYELIGEIARGGMGVVYRARQVSLNRIVALKMILSGQLASESDVIRFRAEAESAANLDHPNIVPIYEVGEHQSQHYFSMKLVDGGSLSQKLSRSPKPTIRELVEKLSIVTRAVHYAHQRGIMHRDLKPANILLDSQGQPHITDFGLAKHVTGDSHVTVSGSIVGTPSYMPPEQALGSKGLTVVADVYSLGAILYEFLTGKPPFKADNILETLRLVREQEPVRPRVIDPAVDRDLETIALKCLEKDPVRRYASAAELADDLDFWREGKPISARPTTTTERAWKWARRRPAIAGLIAAVAASLIIGITVSTSFAIDASEKAQQAREAEADAKKKAEDEAAAHARAEDALVKEADARKLEVIARGKEVTAREAAQKAQKEEADARAKEAIARRQAVDEKNAKDKEYVRADGLRLAAEADAARFRDPGLALLLATEGAKKTPSHLTFASLYAALAECREERTIFTQARDWNGPDRGWYIFDGDATFTRYLPGGKQLLTVAGNSIRVWEAETGKMTGQWKGFNMPIRQIAMSPDAKRVAVAMSGYAPVRHADGVIYNYTDRVVYVVDLAKGIDVLRLGGSQYSLASVEFSRDGTKLAAASWDGHVRIYDAVKGALIKDIKVSDNALLTARFTPDGKQVLTVTSNVSRSTYGYDWEIEPGTGKPKTDPPFDPEGRPLGPSGHGEGSASGLGGSNVVAKLWDIESGKSAASFNKLPPSLFTFGHVWYPKDGVLSPDGSHSAIAFSGEVTVWETGTGATEFTLKGHEGDIHAVAFRPDGKRIATAGADTTVRLWDLSGRELLRLRGHTQPVVGVRFSPSGTKLVTWSQDRTARVWEVDSGREIVALRGHTDAIRDADFRPDELRVTTAGDSSFRIWTLEATKMPDLALAGHAGKVTAIAYSPDGKFFLTSSADQSARLWDANSGKVVREFGDGRPLGEVRSARFSPDGTKVVTAAANRKATAGEKSVESAVIIWDVATGKQLLSLDELPTGANHAEFTPDGARILTIGDGALRIQFATQNQDPKQPKKTVDLGGFSYSISASNSTKEGIQHLWDAKSGKLISTLFQGKENGWRASGERTTFAFTPDGGFLFTVDKTRQQMPTMYRTSDGKDVRTFRMASRWGGGSAAVGLSRDGKTAIVERNGELALYDAFTGLHIATLKGFPGSITDFTFSQDGKRLAIACYKAAFIYDMPDRKLVSTLKGHLAEVTKVMFSPDGSRVLTGAADDMAAVWETETGKMLSVCKGHTGKLTDVLFRADGQQVATLAADGTARLWPVDLWPGVTARTPRALRSDEAERFEVAIAGQPKGVDWRDRVPVSDPPPGTPLPELFTLAKIVTPPEVLQARQAALTALRALPTATPEQVEAARVQAHQLIRDHAGTPESSAAGELLTRLPSPLGMFDAKSIATAERNDQLPKEVVAVLGESRQRELSNITRVLLSSAGRVVATRSWSEGETSLWDAETLDRRGRIRGAMLRFAPDREELFTFSRSQGVFVDTWDVSGPEPKKIREAKLPSAGLILAMSADGKFAAGCGHAYDELRLWDLTSKETAGRRLHKTASGYNEYRTAAFSPAGDKLAVQINGGMLMYDVRDPAKPPVEILKQEKGLNHYEFELAFSPDGTRLAGRIPDAIVLWDVTASPVKEARRLVKKGVWTNDFRFSADGSKLFVLHGGRDSTVWDLKANPPTEKPEFTKHFGGASSFALSKDENRLFATLGVSVRGFERTPDGWRERGAYSGPSHGIKSLAFGADGRTLYAADDSEAAWAWRLDGDRYVNNGEIGSVGRWLRTMPDDRTLIGGTYGFALWDLPTRTRKTQSLDRKQYAPVFNAMSTDGKWLARGNFEPAITLMDLRGSEPRLHATINKLSDHNVAGVAISPDGRFLVAAPDQQNEPKPIHAWRVTDKGVQAIGLPFITGSQIAFSPDGRTMAVADFHSLTFIDLGAEAPVVGSPIELPRESSREMPDLMFSADGAKLITVRERKVGVWSVAEGKQLSGLELPSAPDCAALAPDGRHLAVGNKNGTIWIVRIKP